MSVPQTHTMSRRSRVPGAVIGASVLLFFQALGLIALSVIPFLLDAGEWNVWPWLEAQIAVVHSTTNVARGLIVIQGLLAFASATGLLRLRREAWVLAMAVQGFQLLIGLILYLSIRPGYIYPIMAYSVLMVLYLNYSAVADAFPRDPKTQDRGETR